MGDETDDVIKELFESFSEKYQEKLEEKTKEASLILKVLNYYITIFIKQD